jgi:hypothetical protein
MKIAVAKEVDPSESRVVASPGARQRVDAVVLLLLMLADGVIPILDGGAASALFIGEKSRCWTCRR